jgi:hypothetical protein
MVLACAFIAARAEATSVVVRKTVDSVFVASDTKMLVVDSQNKVKAHVDSKIIKLGKLAYFVSAGLSSHAGLKLNVSSMAARAFKRSKTFLECAKTFERLMIPGLTNAAVDLRKNHHSTYIRFKKSKDILDAAFCGMENGSPRAFVLTFNMEEKQNGRIEIKSGQKLSDLKMNEVSLFGSHDRSSSYLRQHTDIFPTMGEQASLNKLIQLEIDADPKYVGPPIDILKISREGATWLQHDRK